MKNPNRKWVVLVAGFLSYFLVAGFPYSLTVMYVEWLDDFGKSNSETAVIQSVCMGMFMIMGFAAGSVIAKFGTRKCGICAGVVAALSVGVSYFATSLTYLIVSVGLLAGTAFSVTYVCATTEVGMNFEGKHKIMALAVVTFGSGVGSSSFPGLFDLLNNKYGWRGTHVISAAILLHLILCSYIYGGVNREQSTSSITNDIFTVSDSNQSYDGASNKDIINDEPNSSRIQKEIGSRISMELSRVTKTPILSIFRQVLSNKIFIVYAATYAVSYSVYTALLIFLIDFFESKELMRSEGVAIFLYMNFTSSFSRLLTGVIKQIPHVSVLAIPTICSLLGGIAIALLALTGNSISLNTILACAAGASQGSMVTVLSLSVVKFVDVKHFAVGMGIIMTFTGTTSTLFGPFIGHIRDVTGSYDKPFYVLSGLSCSSSIVFFLVMVFRHWTIGHKEHKTTTVYS